MRRRVVVVDARKERDVIGPFGYRNGGEMPGAFRILRRPVAQALAAPVDEVAPLGPLSQSRAGGLERDACHDQPPPRRIRAGVDPPRRLAPQVRGERAQGRQPGQRCIHSFVAPGRVLVEQRRNTCLFGPRRRGQRGSDDDRRAGRDPHLRPIAISSPCVRSSSRPSEIAGVASTGADISFIASCSYFGPAAITKICPSSLAMKTRPSLPTGDAVNADVAPPSRDSYFFSPVLASNTFNTPL